MRVIEKADDILGVDSLLTQAERAKAKPVPKPTPKKKEYPIRLRIKYIPNRRTGRPYYYLVQTYIDNQGRHREKVIKYLGIRKPRDIAKLTTVKNRERTLNGQ